MLYNGVVHKIKKEKRRIERKNNMKKLALIGVGAAIGSAAAALATPKKGEDLRKDLKKGYKDAVYNLKFKAEEVKEQVKDTIDENKAKINKIKSAAKDTKEELSSVVKEKAKDVKNDVESNIQAEKDIKEGNIDYKMAQVSETLENDGKVVAEDVQETKDDLYKTVKDVKSDLR